MNSVWLGARMLQRSQTPFATAMKRNLAKKAPKPPKKPPTAYMLFCDDNRSNISLDDADPKRGIMIFQQRALSKMWKEEVDQATKDAYAATAAQKRDEWKAEMEAFKATSEEPEAPAHEEGKNKNKKKQGSRGPSGFNIFIKEKKAETSGTMNAAAATKEFSHLWKQMSDEEKSPYLEKSKAIKAEIMS